MSKTIPPVEITLDGNVPSKKNQRINTSSGRSFPSKKYSDWHVYALQQVRMQTRARIFKPVSVEIIIYFGTNGRADLDNRITSILDMLVDAMVLRDDKWQDVPRLRADAVYRKGQPGAFIRIMEIG